MIISVFIVILLLFTVSPAPAQGERIVIEQEGGVIGCTPPFQKRIKDYALARDFAAGDATYALGLRTGACYLFARGTTVIVVERDNWSNQTRIKAPGSLSDFWISGYPK
jgi:hypothetical protein